MPAKTPAKLRLERSAHTGHNITERKEGRGSDSSLQQQLSVESFAEIPKLISEITQITSSLSELQLRQADGGRLGAAQAAATCQKANSAVNYNRTVRLSDWRIIFIRWHTRKQCRGAAIHLTDAAPAPPRMRIPGEMRIYVANNKLDIFPEKEFCTGSIYNYWILWCIPLGFNAQTAGTGTDTYSIQTCDLHTLL